ncbi:lipid-A-disaccharide synthase [Oscillatoria sp. CS-180]|uniref:lipid-A-disaccharide synthase n=1 Tax=Oscillatoria sp. CS-180 TaxID=3021720 RepID=UPI0023308CA0|nr:lipid-A-disaccharide synthase [Oscillatoria sp. CS-180]MDB9528560.1 lipid-A-disaccharide synthase [Oscillatoria sp. CS-180]
MENSRDRSVQCPPLHILVSTGEVSGDLQGSYLVQALHRQANALGVSLEVSALGGNRMATAGAKLIGDTTPIGSVGLLEALPHAIPSFLMQRRTHQFLRETQPDLLVFIDYMVSNLSLGKFLQKHFPSVPTAYYIAPQQWVWAFNQKDTQALVDISDRMVAVFPQEAEYYRRYGADVSYFGHPLVDKLESPPERAVARQKLGIAPDAQVVTLLPASRYQEVNYILPLMLSVAEQIQRSQPQVEFLIPLSMNQLRSRIEAAIARSSINARLIDNDSLQAIAAADLVLNKSGTVNLEVALMNVPQIVIYRLNPITARVAYYLLNFKVDFVSPVNLFLNEQIVPEFIQWEATVESITAASLRLLEDTDARQAMLVGYGKLRERMGQPGVCDRVAAHLLDFALQHRQLLPAACSR